MGICPNCGIWIDEGDICRCCGRNGSYEPEGVEGSFDESRCDNFSPKRDEYSKKTLNNPFHLDFVYTWKGVLKEFGILDFYKWITLSDHLFGV